MYPFALKYLKLYIMQSIVRLSGAFNSNNRSRFGSLFISTWLSRTDSDICCAAATASLMGLLSVAMHQHRHQQLQQHQHSTAWQISILHRHRIRAFCCVSIERIALAN